MSNGGKHPRKLQRKVQEERNRQPDVLLLWRGEDDDSESLSGLSSMDRTEERAGSNEHILVVFFQEFVG